MPNVEAPAEHVPSHLSRRAGIVLGLLVLAVYLWFIAQSFFLTGGWLNTLLQDHYVFFVGLPFAALIAFITVSLFESARGSIEFEVATLKFKGASGPIIMWVLVYIAVVGSYSVAWPMK